jgi:hypothetical protein
MLFIATFLVDDKGLLPKMNEQIFDLRNLHLVYSHVFFAYPATVNQLEAKVNFYECEIFLSWVQIFGKSGRRAVRWVCRE